jgi:hypothetical protein
MTASHLTYLAAREHINDLMRDADRRRIAAEARPPRRLAIWIPRVLARRATRAATT